MGGYRTNRSLPLPTRILKVYVEALTGFSLIYHPNGLSNTLPFQACILEISSGYGNGRQDIHSEAMGEGKEPPITQVHLEGQVFLMTKSNNY